MLPANYLDSAGGYTADTEFFVTEGKEYLVYCIACKRDQIWYYICDDYYTDYPRPFPAPLFAIENGKLSQYWVFSTTDNHTDHFCLIAFPEWVEDAYFYDRLTDGKEEEVALFHKIKGLIDLEFKVLADNHY